MIGLGCRKAHFISCKGKSHKMFSCFIKNTGKKKDLADDYRIIELERLFCVGRKAAP